MDKSLLETSLAVILLLMAKAIVNVRAVILFSLSLYIEVMKENPKSHSYRRFFSSLSLSSSKILKIFFGESGNLTPTFVKQRV